MLSEMTGTKNSLHKKPTLTQQRKLDTIRRQNLVRHERSIKLNKMNNDIRRATNNNNARLEYDRLREANTRHNGLGTSASERLAELAKRLDNKNYIIKISNE